MPTSAPRWRRWPPEIQAVTGEHVELAYVDQGYTGEEVATDAAEHGIHLEVVKLPEAKRGFVLLPRRWVVERCLRLDGALPPPGARLRAVAAGAGGPALPGRRLPHAPSAHPPLLKFITRSRACRAFYSVKQSPAERIYRISVALQYLSNCSGGTTPLAHQLAKILACPHVLVSGARRAGSPSPRASKRSGAPVVRLMLLIHVQIDKGVVDCRHED